MASKTRDSDGGQSPSTGSALIAILNNIETELLGNPGADSTKAGSLQGMDVELMDRFEFGFKNTGANSAVLKVYYQYVVNGQWFQDLGAGNAPTVAAGTSARLSFSNITARRVRVTALCASGVGQGQCEGRGMGYQ